jgi:acyl carrier protein
MNKEEIEKSVCEIVKITVLNQDIIHISEITVNPESNLRQDLGLDSLALAELAVRIEARFNIDVFEDSIPKTVNEIINKLT